MRITPLLRRAAGAPTAEAIKANCRKVVCIGRNYADHITELNNQRPSSPFFFLKPPSSIITQDSPIRVPNGVTVHHEVELGLVMGKLLRNLHPDDETAAMGSIAHYFTAIDLTARNVQDAAKRKSLPWTIAKGFDTFLPISGGIPKTALPDPYQANLSLRINGKTKQVDKAELMLFRLPRILSEISRVMTLEEGDLVLTGTPKGVGPVQVGDRVEVGIDVQGKQIEEGRGAWDVAQWEGDYAFKEN
ncbi:MAG: hypothetical protein M1828_001927 [Chrysothrix sp. TS-e1954]|nr:MAG: hypothetical protein M1828_001927 [Chrysothrix sp. TS-e1954]